MRLLAASDLHLGRRPAHLPASVADPRSVRDWGPAGAWRRLVALALREEVDALLLAGDVVDGEDDFFEAYRELATGVERLAEAGVHVLAVAGNHDTKVLPYLADQVEAFELLGRGGRWESRTLRSAREGSSEAVTIHGWSFPQASFRRSPLEGHSFQRGPGPNLGLLHCDRDQAGSAYAPVSSRALEAARLDGWLLGHIHRPDPLALPRPSGYLGSLTGLDPGEPGPRGGWLLRIQGGRLGGLERRALGPLRWERLRIAVDGIEEPEEARARLLSRLDLLLDEVAAEPEPPLGIGVRATLTGRTRFGRELAPLFAPDRLEELVLPRGDVRCFVERVSVEVLPEVELEALSRRDDPAGLLARRLLLLDADPDDPARAELVARGRKRLARVAGDTPWAGLEREPPDDDETAEWLRRAGRQALELLLAQQGDG